MADIQYYGTGRRKTSTARVYLRPGSGNITVNKREFASYFPNETLQGHVERISPASGSQFALLPPDNATGNFTKVVQRIPVRIALDAKQPLLERLLPGMSVVTRIDTGDGGK